MRAVPSLPPCAIHVSHGTQVEVFTQRDGYQDYLINIYDVFARLDRSTGRLWLCSRIVRGVGTLREEPDGRSLYSIRFSDSLAGTELWMTFDEYVRDVWYEPWLKPTEDEGLVDEFTGTNRCYDQEGRPDESRIIAVWRELYGIGEV